MTRTVKEMRERQAKLVHDAREELEKITDETPETEAKEIEGRYDKLMAEHDALDEKIERQERLDKAEERLDDPDPRRPKGGKDDVELDDDKADEAMLQKRAFDHALRYGISDMPANLRAKLRRPAIDPETGKRAQSVGTTTAGGFLSAEGFMAELIKTMSYFGPMLDEGVIRMLDTDRGNVLPWPQMDDTGNTGALLSENTQDSEQDITFSEAQLDAYKYTTKIIRVSEELLQDASIDVEGIIRDAFAERIGRIVNQHLTTGTGSSQPNGIVTASTLGATSAAAGTITFDDMLDLLHSVDRAYRSGPKVAWMFHDTTLKNLRKLKDGNSNYIWQPADATRGTPQTILDYPFRINNDMGTVSTSESPSVGEKAVLFGDFGKYVVRRVRELIIKRLVERYADYHQVGFVGFARFDGELVDTAAVKHLQQAL